MMLRREADAAGDVQISSLLESLEPILIDIANLPDKPDEDAVRVIRERVERKNIVAAVAGQLDRTRPRSGLSQFDSASGSPQRHREQEMPCAFLITARSLRSLSGSLCLCGEPKLKQFND